MRLAIVLVVVACAGKGPTPTDEGSNGAVRDPRTAIEKRRDAGCDALAPKLVQCAVDDAKADLAAGRVSKKDFDEQTAPVWLERLEAKWLKECKIEQNLTSRRVRVLEVCFREETACEPLLGCLENLKAQNLKPQ